MANPNHEVSRMTAERTVGSRFGRLVVLAYHRGSHDKESRVDAVCDCGARINVILRSLREGHTKSCGCMSRELFLRRSTKHGRNGSPEHLCWKAMRARCYNPNASNFAWYGAKGVSVCERWRDSFENFFADMGPRPSKGYTVDRIDPLGNYEPSNCRWATWAEQAKNKRSSRKPEDGDAPRGQG